MLQRLLKFILGWLRRFYISFRGGKKIPSGIPDREPEEPSEPIEPEGPVVHPSETEPKKTTQKEEKDTTGTTRGGDDWLKDILTTTDPEPAESIIERLHQQPVDATTLELLQKISEREKETTSAPAPTGDPVRCSVYAPQSVVKEEEFLILAFAHLKEQAEEVEETAKLFDEAMTKKAAKILNTKVPKGSQLEFRLHFKEDFIDGDHSQTLTWQGEASSVEFIVFIPDTYEKASLIGTIYISLDSVPIGQIKFKLQVADSSSQSQKEVAETEAKHYRYAFVSYSSKDRKEVLKRTQMLEKVGVEFFQDLLDLNPGERWQKGLYKNIDQCDVFLLFWSTHSKDSKWVTKEWEYALARKGDNEMAAPDIIPVPIEGPPPPRPPDALRHLHFNDTFLYFLNVDDKRS